MHEHSRQSTISAAVCLAILFLATARAGAQAPELRGLWVSRFEWAQLSPSGCRKTIDAAMSTLADSRFNAVFFQIRGQADVLYPSPEEVWSTLIGGQDPGWDPLTYAIDAAHAHGLEFHAYFNTHTCYQSTAHLAPQNLDHLYYKHCDARYPETRDWLIHSSINTPVQYAEDDYVWLAPGVPAFQSYLRRQVLYIVENYDLDGVHFDRIRTPNSLYSYDPISMSRLADAQTNPYGLDFHEWTADQITRNVRDIYAAVAAVKPWVKISAAVFKYPLYSPYSQHQDATAWMAAGALDFVVPMDYEAGAEGSPWDTRFQQWLERSSGRHVVMGHRATVPFEDLYAQIQLVRMRGGAGTNLFSWTKLYSSLLEDYKNIAYPTVVATPAMPWKSSPQTGILQGMVEDPVGNRVVDAQVRYSSDSYVALSSGDGYYAHLLVPAGTYTLTINHPECVPAQLADVSVAPGVNHVDLAFAQVLVPKTRLVADKAEVIIEDSVAVTPRVAVPAGDNITSWTLDLGDETSLTGSGTPAPVDHVYAEVGSYEATFSMTTSLHGNFHAEPVTINVLPKPPIPGDFDGDRDVDQEDFGAFQSCLSGETVPQNRPECAPARLDADIDVDQFDLVLFTRCITGPGQVGDPGCAQD